ncbi:MAG: potassium channel protein [Candidatus Firestonebacteria bacterium]
MAKKTINILITLAVVLLVGVLGYVGIEKWSFLDALYMTIITLATVGYGETNPLSQNGRIFTMFLILCGTGVLVYVASSMTAFFVEGELKGILRRRKMEKKIKKLSSHYIICGGDRTGKYIIDEMIKTKRDFVLIEKNVEKVKKLEEQNILYVLGNAEEDDTLLKAGIKQAKGLVATLASDQDNLFVVLTARELNPNLRIVSKMLEENSVQKFKKAGADGVVSPNLIGGLRLVSELIRPTVTSFLDSMLREKEKTLRVDEVEIPDNSPFAGKSLESAEIAKRTNLIVLAVKQADNARLQFNPDKKLILKTKDILIVMDDVNDVEILRKEIGVKV